MNEHFDISRLLKLIHGDLVQRYRVMFTVSAALGVLAIVHALVYQTGMTDRSAIYLGLLGIMIFGWGPIAASHSFKELNNKKQNEAYLLLPASAFEKMLSRLILIAVIFPLYALVFVTLIAWLITAIRAALFGVGDPLFVPLEAFDIQLAGLFLVHQSLFFLGAAWFRKHHFVRTVLSLGIGSIALILLAGLLVRLWLPEYSTGGFGINIDISPSDLFSLLEGAMTILKFVTFVALPVFCWFVAWLRIKETQVSHGI
jgi:hypothetical protein